MHKKRGPKKDPKALEIGQKLYESCVKCAEIAQIIGYSVSTVQSARSMWGWERKNAVLCTRCGVDVPRGKKAGSAYPRVCEKCTRERYREKGNGRVGMTPDERRAYQRAVRERAAAKQGRALLTPDQLRERWEQLRKSAPRRQRPLVQVGRYRHYGEQPTTREGGLAILQATLSKLLTVRCEAEGVTRDAIEYRTRYQNDEAFRERERLRTSGKRWGNRLGDGKDDGTLTKEVVRKLFSRAKKCPYCWHPMTSQDKSLDHMHPLSLGGDHSLSNVLVCCRRCNSRKHDTPYAEWLAKIPEVCERALRERAA